MYTSKIKNIDHLYHNNRPFFFKLKESSLSVKGKEFSTQNFNNKSEQNEIKNKVQVFLNDLDIIADQLVQNINFENLDKYKSQLKKIFNYVLKFNYHVRVISGRKMDYKIIHIINEKLHDLTFWILKKEKTKILFMNQLNEIKGLIIDVFN